MVVDTLEIVVLAAFWAFTIWRFVTPQTVRGRAIRTMVLLATVSFTFNRREISYATDQLLHVPDISVPLKNLATVACSVAMVHTVGLLSPDPDRWVKLRRATYALLAVTAAAMVVLFLLTPRSPARGDFVFERAGTPTVVAYGLLTQLGLTVGLVGALVLFRPAGRAVGPGLLRTGMWLLSAAAVTGLLFMANRVAFQLTHAAGSTVLDGPVAQFVSRGLLAMMLLLFAAGAALPALGGLRRWVANYIALQRLRPLWWELSTAAPGVVLGDRPGRAADIFDPRSVQLRLYRRVIEIRDAQWLLAGRSGDSDEDVAAVRSAVLAASAAGLAQASPGASTAGASGPRAFASRTFAPGASAPGASAPGAFAPGASAPGAFEEAGRAGRAGPPGASPSTGGDDVKAEVRALLGFSRRYHTAAARGVVATPVVLHGHNDPPGRDA